MRMDASPVGELANLADLPEDELVGRDLLACTAQ